MKEAALIALLWLMAIGCHTAAAARISVSISQPTVYTTEYGNLRLRCDFSSEPEYVFWYYSSYEGDRDRAVMVRCFYQLNKCALADGFTNWTNAVGTANGSLSISGVARQQDGYYECEGTSSLDVARAGMRIFVVASGSVPAITQTPSVPVSGDFVTLSCLTTGWNPPVNLTWSKMPVGYASPISLTGPAVSLANSPPTVKFGDSSISATMAVGPSDDESVFACSAAQLGTGVVSAGRVKIRVEHKPTLASVPDIVAIEGSAVSITCQAKGHPTLMLQLLAANGSVLQESPSAAFGGDSGSGSSSSSSGSSSSSSSSAVSVFTLASPDRSQSGSYACRAANTRGSATSPFHLDVLYPPSVQAPAAVTVREGDPARLTCSVSGNPRPASVQWRHIVTGEVRANASVGTAADLLLDSVQRQQSGEWRCEVRALLTPTAGASLEFSASASVHLTVQYRPGAPAVRQPTEPALAGGRVNLTCLPSSEAPGEPPPSIRWSRSPTTSDEAAIAPESGSSSLVVDRVGLGDTGVYYCHASNLMGASHSIPVSLQVVQAPQAAAAAAAGQPIRARAGDGNFSLACGVTAQPRPLIRWLRGGSGGGGVLATDSGPLYSAQYEISAEPFRYTSTLYFRGSQRASVQLNDTGGFICEAINDLGAVQQTFQLVVEVPPRITNELSKVAQVPGCQLTCQFVSHRPLEVTWTGPDGKNLSVNASAASDLLPWQLTSSLIGPLSLGNYTCSVQNSLGRDSRTIRLVPASPPDPPLSAVAVATGWDRLKLVWAPGFDGGLPTRLRVNLTGWNASLGRPATVAMETNVSLGQLEVTRLYPDTAYTVSLTPVNQLGQGAASSAAVTTGHLRLPQPTGARWDPATGVLTFSAGAGGYCARLQESRDGGDVWATVGACRDCEAAGGEVRLTLGDPDSLYRVSLCLADRSDVCGVPYTTYTVASQATISMVAIIIATCVCAGIVVSLVAALICLWARRHSTLARTGKSQPLAAESQLAPSTPAVAATASIRRSQLHLPQQRPHPPAIAFVSPAMTERSSNQTQETCMDGSSSFSCTNGSSSSPIQSGSSLGLHPHHQQHQQLVCQGVVYGSDLEDNSNCCYSTYTPPTHRKVIYEVVV